MDIIVVGQQAWDIELGCNNKNIALELSESHRVMYVNPPLDRITVIRLKNDEKVKKRLNIIGGKDNGIEQINDNLWTVYPDAIIESINWIKITFLYNIINKWNNRLFSKSIKKAIAILDFNNYILFNDSDMFRSFYMQELIHPKLSIYYSRDYFQANEYYKYHGSRLEPMLINKSSLCVANSSFLTNFCLKYNPNSFFVGQGCDLELFLNADVKTPPDCDGINGPVIGYVGALFASRLDIEILSFIAKSNPTWQIVLVGPEDDDFASSDLHRLANIHFLGMKEPERLPEYIMAFDVCINPQILNDFTRGNYPRKIDEYLAMGKPIVATKTEAMEMFSDYTYLALGKEEYVGLITRALEEDSPAEQRRRKDFASTHSWENSVGQIYEAINTVLAQQTA